jgi:glycosyltransferase involved in cell wall biosynthesis
LLTDISRKQFLPLEMQTESQSIDRISKVPQPPRLPHPVRITEQTWPEGTVPVVTIKCVTYQHVNFIRDAIEGFLMQETTFPVEILIHDDASTDGTADIVREYQAKYPQLIRTVLQTENQYSKGREASSRARKPFNEMVRGEFIALCEGDDYWISPRKLEKQLRLMERAPQALLCGARCFVHEEPSQTPYRIEPDKPGSMLRDLEPYDYICGKSFVRPPTRMLRTTILNEFVQWSGGRKVAGDWSLLLFCAWRCQETKGRILFIDEVHAVYREHQGGMWSGASNVERSLFNLNLSEQFCELFRGRALDHMRTMRALFIAQLAQSAELPVEKRLNFCILALRRRPFSLGLWRGLLSTLRRWVLRVVYS